MTHFLYSLDKKNFLFYELKMKKVLLKLLMLSTLYSSPNQVSNSIKGETLPKNEFIAGIPKNSLGYKVSDKSIPKTGYLTLREIREYLSELYHPMEHIPKKYIEKITFKESNFNVFALNRKTKAGGLMQILEPTWKEVNSHVLYEFGVFDPKENLKTGIKYLRNLSSTISKINPDWKNLTNDEKSYQILAAYNWGIGNLQKNNWNISKSPKETKEYIKYITGYEFS